MEQILKIGKVVFDYRPFKYIPNRSLAYNVNTPIYFDLKDLENLAGIAIVTNELMGQKTAHFEKRFSPVPFHIFTTMKEAIAWSESLLHKK